MGRVEPHSPYRYLMDFFCQNFFSLALSDWYQLQLTDDQSFYNYQADSDYLTPFSPIVSIKRAYSVSGHFMILITANRFHNSAKTLKSCQLQLEIMCQGI